MKKSLIAFGGAIIFAATVFTNYSCNSVVKGCTNPKDDNYNAAATEDDGTCDEAATTNKFVGNFLVNETCPGGNSTYNIAISKSSSTSYQILVGNFAEVFSNNVIASISQNSLTIASQEPDNDDFLVEGSGTITNNTLNYSYKVTNNLGIETTCQCTATKQ